MQHIQNNQLKKRKRAQQFSGALACWMWNKNFGTLPYLRILKPWNIEKWTPWKLYIYIYIYLPMFQAYAVAEQLVLKCLPMLLLPVPSASEGTSHKTQNDPNIFNFQNGVKTTKRLSQAKIRFPWEILSNRSCGRSRARACFKLRIHQGHTHTKIRRPQPTAGGERQRKSVACEA